MVLRRFTVLVAAQLSACATMSTPAPTPAAREAAYAALAARGVCEAAPQLPPLLLRWSAPRPDLEHHHQFRATRGETVPEGRQRVAVRAAAGHHMIFDASVVAVRGADGRWRADAVSETRSGIMPWPPGATSDPNFRIEHRSWTLSAQDSAAVDAAIASPCLPAAPSAVSPVPNPGCLSRSIEVYDGARLVGAVAQSCGGWGVAADIATAILRDADRAPNLRAAGSGG